MLYRCRICSLLLRKSLVRIRLGSSTPNHPRTHVSSLAQPLHNKVLDNLLGLRRTALLQHLDRLPPLLNLPHLFQTLQTLHPHTDLLDRRLLALVVVILQTHRHVLVRHNLWLCGPGVQCPEHAYVGSAGGNALLEGCVNVFAEF